MTLPPSSGHPSWDSPPPQWNQGQAPPPRKSNAWKWILGVIAAVLLCAIGGMVIAGIGIGGAVKSVEKAETDRLSHVELTGCKRTIIDSIEVTYRITNRSDTQQSYMLEIDVTSGSERVGTATGFEDAVPAGGTANGTAVGTVTAENGALTCTLRSA